MKIPSELFGMFTLSDLVIKYHDDYLEAGLTPTFVPPTGLYVAPAFPKFDHSEYRFTTEIDSDGNVSITDWLEEENNFLQI